ncbi:CsgE family curli-type amyloid fiber assembly protein, partial [Enterobacter asburiae]|uniref:CsgE family curli-type amyloid fiber assembly protein n=1 Tax=Enterobacter asburiae TaxID=61645 RepID=UPI002FF9C560
ADRNRSHWSTSKTPSYTKSVSWQHHPNQNVIYQTFLFPTKIDFDKNVVLALEQSEDAINRLQIDKALLSTSDLAKDEF